MKISGVDNSENQFNKNKILPWKSYIRA